MINKEKLTEIKRALLLLIPHIGSSLERILFWEKYAGDEEKLWKDEVKQMLLSLIDQKKEIDPKIDFAKIEREFENTTLGELREIYAQEFKKEINRQWINRLNSRLDIQKTEKFDKDSLRDLKTLIESGESLGESIMHAIVLPPYISHLHIAIFRTLYMLAEAGFKINLVLLDTPYLKLRSQSIGPGTIPWPPMSIAIHNIETIYYKLPTIMGFTDKIINRLNIIRESQLIKDGYTLSVGFNEFQDELIKGEKLKESFKKTSIYARWQSSPYIITQTILREFFFAIDPLNSRFVVLGPDRFDLWKRFVEYVKHSYADRIPSYLFLKKIPPKTGERVYLDMNMYFVNKFSKGKPTTAFLDWFANEQGKDNINEKEVSDFFESLEKIIELKTIDEVILETLKEDRNFIGCYCFGGQQYIRNTEEYRNLAHNRMESPTDIATGDIDLIFVVEKKDISSALKIEYVLRKFGSVNFHPDFYSKRDVTEVFFEVIVIPKGSKYFKTKGVLTGLSALKQDTLVTIFGPPISEVLELPDPAEMLDKEKRLEYYKICDYGINHMLSVIYTQLTKADPKIDYKRVIKYIALDFAWVIKGEFLIGKTKAETLNKLKNFYKEYDTKIYHFLINTFKTNMESEVGGDIKKARIAFELLSYIASKIKKNEI